MLKLPLGNQEQAIFGCGWGKGCSRLCCSPKEISILCKCLNHFVINRRIYCASFSWLNEIQTKLNWHKNNYY